jgi:hypothetical protein
MRAMHLEVAHSLKADSATFSSMPWKPSQHFNAKRELLESLREINQDWVANELSAQGVQWIFNPPAAPWFGGAWESLAKSTKQAMKAIMGNVVTVDEVFLTVVAEVKSLLNSRPLVYGGSSTSATDVSDAK